jgi:hypothetical protein
MAIPIPSAVSIRAMERIGPGMIAISEKNDAADIACDLGRISEMQDVAEKHRCQNCDTSFPRTWSQHGTGQGAK